MICPAQRRSTRSFKAGNLPCKMRTPPAYIVLTAEWLGHQPQTRRPVSPAQEHQHNTAPREEGYFERDQCLGPILIHETVENATDGLLCSLQPIHKMKLKALTSRTMNAAAVCLSGLAPVRSLCRVSAGGASTTAAPAVSTVKIVRSSNTCLNFAEGTGNQQRHQHNTTCPRL